MLTGVVRPSVRSSVAPSVYLSVSITGPPEYTSSSSKYIFSSSAVVLTRLLTLGSHPEEQGIYTMECSLFVRPFVLRSASEQTVYFKLDRKNVLKDIRESMYVYVRPTYMVMYSRRLFVRLLVPYQLPLYITGSGQTYEVFHISKKFEVQRLFPFFLVFFGYMY